MKDATDAELIRAALGEASPAAYTVLVRRYERLVWSVAWHVLRDYHATQDVTQETFLIAHERLHELRQPDSIGAWLSMIARREAQRVRSNQQAETLEFRDIAEPTSASNPSDELQQIIEAIGRLPDHEREVTALRYLNGHSVTEVARLLGRPVGTVTKQLSRAVKRLRSEVNTEIHASLSVQPSKSRHDERT